MTSTLESMPDEILLLVSSFVADPKIREIGLIADPVRNVQSPYTRVIGAYEVDTPELKSLRSLRLASSSLVGPASDAVRGLERASCHTLILNFFHTRDATKGSVPRTVMSNDPGVNITATVPGRFLYNTYLQDCQKIDVNFSLHFQRGHVHGLHIVDVLFSCSAKFSRMKSGMWKCNSSYAETVNSCELWNFAPSDIAKALQTAKDYLTWNGCMGLNSNFPSGKWPDYKGGKMSSHRLDDMVDSIGDIGDFEHTIKSLRGQTWTITPAWDKEFKVDHDVKSHYIELDEIAPGDNVI